LLNVKETLLKFGLSTSASADFSSIILVKPKISYLSKH
jgi:hypothetical protein